MVMTGNNKVKRLIAGLVAGRTAGVQNLSKFSETPCSMCVEENAKGWWWRIWCSYAESLLLSNELLIWLIWIFSHGFSLTFDYDAEHGLHFSLSLEKKRQTHWWIHPETNATTKFVFGRCPAFGSRCAHLLVKKWKLGCSVIPTHNPSANKTSGAPKRSRLSAGRKGRRYHWFSNLRLRSACHAAPSEQIALTGGLLLFVRGQNLSSSAFVWSKIRDACSWNFRTSRCRWT